MATRNPFLRPSAESGWKVENRVRGVAGVLVLIGTGLTLLSPWWLLLLAFVGVNLLQSSLTGWCLMNNLLAMLGSRDRA